ncbi:MAG: hypothetical protein AAGH15_13585 [Myxococcota bacterium]
MRWAPVLILALGCGDASASAGGGGAADMGATFADLGMAAADMGGTEDFGAGQDDAEGFPLTPGPDLDNFYEGEKGVAACYDGRDNDGDEAGAIDCADPSCREALRSCCVGDATCCAPPAAATLVSPGLLADCDAGLDCLAATSFGRPSPFVDRAGLVPALAPGGDGSFDSGIVFDEVLDLRSRRVELRGRFVPGEACAEACGEAVAFGVRLPGALGAESFVTPVAGLVYSGPRREVALLVGGNVAARWPEGAVASWALELSPDGSLRVLRDEGEGAEVLAEGVPFDAAEVVPVVWGHSQNPGASGAPLARLAALELSQALCDMPRAWQARETLTFRVSGRDADAPAGRSPSLGRDGSGRSALAYASGGGVFIARRAAEDLPREHVLADLSNPTYVLPGADLEEPELLTDALGSRYLYARAVPREGGGEAVLGRVRLDDALAPVGAFEGLQVPMQGSAPSLLRLTAETASYAMALRTDLGIEVLVSGDGLTFGPTAPESVIPTGLLGADAIGEPALVAHGGSYRLYLAWRRGSRWRVALFASHELLFWRLVDAEALLPGHGAEALGVRGLDARAEGDALEVVYAGDDGRRPTLHRAELPAAADARF